MYIKKVKILGFGKWVDKEFDFHSDLQIIRGANESGKTTLLAFIKSILFGFATGKQKYAQYLPKNSSQYGGELTLVDNDDTWLIRRKEGKFGGEVTLFKNDLEVPNTLLSDIVKSVTKDLYETTYVINHNNIDKFNELTKDQLITEVLTVGAVNSSQWLNYSQVLDKSSGDIYKPTGKNPILNKELKHYDELISQKDNYQSQKDLYDDLHNDKATLEMKISELAKKQATLNNKSIEIEKYTNQESDYVELQTLNEQLGNNQLKTISDDDWNLFTLNKEKINSITLNKDKLNNELPQLTNYENDLLENYEANKKDIDEIEDKIEDLNKEIFTRNQLEEQRNKQEKQVIMLQEKYNLQSNATPLNLEELHLLQDSITKKADNNTLIIAGVGGIITILSFLISSAAKYLGIVVGIIIMGYFGFKYFNIQKTSDTSSVEKIINKHGYVNFSVEDIIELQPQLKEINRLQLELQETLRKLTEADKRIEVWNNKLQQFKIIQNSEIDIKEVRNYFNNLMTVIRKKEALITNKQNFENETKILDTNLQELAKMQTNILNKYDETTELDFEVRKNNENQNKIKIKRKEILDETLKSLNTYLKSNNIDFKELYEIKQSVDNDLKQVSNEILTINDQLAKIKLSLNDLVSDEKYLELQKNIDDTADKIIELFDDWAAHKLASKWIYDTLNLASANRFPKMLERTAKYFKIMTDGKYIKIDIKNKSIKVQSNNKQKFDLGELSKGTIAQLFIALRSSFVMEISDIVQLPILIDDAFNDFDKTRLLAGLKLIKEMSKENQIIFVTTDALSQEYFDDERVISL